ncbi:hypothetical protein G7Z17_g13402 [Cylindrodendrum hubeiense]|uniref:Uncharacterized protein n=1 Tax=Cylindrodendrum hubeiense TaxID=595255 RepID=A0A9P5L8A1_9HYPO|nr:hypothetical protein G7Z17_g13402 [Cylindrodendrum hubeiense]
MTPVRRGPGGLRSLPIGGIARSPRRPQGIQGIQGTLQAGRRPEWAPQGTFWGMPQGMHDRACGLGIPGRHPTAPNSTATDTSNGSSGARRPSCSVQFSSGHAAQSSLQAHRAVRRLLESPTCGSGENVVDASHRVVHVTGTGKLRRPLLFQNSQPDTLRRGGTTLAAACSQVGTDGGWPSLATELTTVGDSPAERDWHKSISENYEQQAGPAPAYHALGYSPGRLQVLDVAPLCAVVTGPPKVPPGATLFQNPPTSITNMSGTLGHSTRRLSCETRHGGLPLHCPPKIADP